MQADCYRAWAKGLAVLGLILFLPFLLLATPLAPLARAWQALLVLALLGICWAAILGAMAGANLPVLVWVEGHLRAWIARFAADPEGLWLHWARHAHHSQAARAYLDQAVRLGGAEALFQEALVLLEGGWGAGGHAGAPDRLRRAGLKGHAEAAFRLADVLRTGQGSVRPEPAEAERWYLRAAALGYGPAAAWLAHAYACGDGVEADEARAAMWASEARSREPHPGPSHSRFAMTRRRPTPWCGSARLRWKVSRQRRTGWWAMPPGAGSFSWGRRSWPRWFWGAWACCSGWGREPSTTCP